MVVQFETYILYLLLCFYMSPNFTENELVLLAIIQNISTPTTPKKIEEKAKKLYETDELIYNGPKPEFTNENIFGRTWNQLITKDYIRHIDSKDNVPLFVDDTNIIALNKICDKFIEKQSFHYILRN